MEGTQSKPVFLCAHCREPINNGILLGLGLGREVSPEAVNNFYHRDKKECVEASGKTLS